MRVGIHRGWRASLLDKFSKEVLAISITQGRFCETLWRPDVPSGEYPPSQEWSCRGRTQERHLAETGDHLLDGQL